MYYDEYEAVDDISAVEEALAHYGMPRRSGRYPWGSGETPYQHMGLPISGITYGDGNKGKRKLLSDDEQSIYTRNKQFLAEVNRLRNEGKTDAEIAKEKGYSSGNELRKAVSIAKNKNEQFDIRQIQEYTDLGYSKKEISEAMDMAPSTIASKMKPAAIKNAFKNAEVVDQLKDQLKSKRYLNVGIGTNTMLGDGVSKTSLDNALKELENEGYGVYELKVSQITNPDQQTTMKVLAPPGATFQEVSRNRIDIQNIVESPNADSTVGILNMDRPAALDSSRVFIRYAEDGGNLKDGVIELRRGVDDLYLGDECLYSQVRINVDDKSYAKGMAVYFDNDTYDDVPPGCDVIINTPKSKGTPIEKVLKPLKTTDPSGNDPNAPIDWDNPFGATIKDKSEGGQTYYTDPETGEKKLRVINKVNDQGDWDDWKRELSAQFLSKQPLALIKKQLDVTYDHKLAMLSEIEQVGNPVVREYLLQEFGRECDSSAVNLHALGLPKQAQKVILPVESLADGECYCPAYNNGEVVMCIRHPHEGTFQIPVLKVNNNNKEGQRVIANSLDAIGIKHDSAEQLSGADYDGDSVIVIPIKGIENIVEAKKPIRELIEFDDKKEYPKAEFDADGNPIPKTGHEPKHRFNKGKEMGMASNLITDMTLKDAPIEHLVRAVKYSMTVIDAEKHNLDWQKCFEDQGIAELRELYQNSSKGGASTLISRARSPEHVPYRSLQVDIDEDGKLVYHDTFKTKVGVDDDGEPVYEYKHKTVIGKDGKEHEKKQEVTKMEMHEDARELMSNPDAGLPQEELYADFANKMKALGNRARKASLGLVKEYNESAARVYAPEVASLMAKYNNAVKNKPYETLANIQANKVVQERIKRLPDDLDQTERKKAIKKMRQQALNAARKQQGSKKPYIEFTEREWEALMANAVRPTLTLEILKNSKSSTIKTMAMPRSKTEITPAMESFIRRQAESGYMLADIADMVGISVSTVDSVIRSKTDG